MRLRYGNIDMDINFQQPTKEIFESWKKEFLKIEGTNEFEIYLVGGFLEKINNKKDYTSDIDIIITGEGSLEKIEKLIYEGTKIGLETHQVFFDIFWFDKLPFYSNMKIGEEVEINSYLLSNKWIINGVVKKEYKKAKRVSENLWKLESIFPSNKQKKLIEGGFIYSEPLLINK